MCDTYISFNYDNTAVFGKNSDRDEKEVQILTYVPGKKYSDGEELRCTHISIPQTSETAAVILSQPYWIWGAEMGANEHGVVIGNEAVTTKEPLKEIGLLGMDLLRLGLERGTTAKEALNLIIDLSESYGLGGAHYENGANCHHSMIIADPNEAYVLELAGEWWIVEIVKTYRSISNHLSIRGRGDLRKKGIIQHAIEKGACKDDKDFDFKMIFSSDPLPEEFPINTRDGCSLNQLAQNKGNVTPALMMEFLREHEVGICEHIRKYQSVGSQVSYLKKNRKKSIHFFTGTTIPCLGIFKPYIFPADNLRFSADKPGPYSEINPKWFWTKHAKFIAQYKKFPKRDIPEREIYYNKIRDIEKNLITNVNEVMTQENKISEDEFIKKIREINYKAWDKSEEMVQ